MFSFTSSRRRGRVAVLTVTAGLLAAVVPALPIPAQAAAPLVTGRACAPGEGVTVVVDYVKAALAGDPAVDRVALGCAEGEQSNGLAALRDAGFAVESVPGSAGAVCQIDGLPAAGYPACWNEGYWQYWRSAGRNATTWELSQVGAGATGTLPVDTVEGWSFALGSDGWSGPAPRLTPDSVQADVDSGLSAPVLSPIAAAEVLPLSGPAGVTIEATVLREGEDESDAEWAAATEIALSPYLDSDITLLLRRAGSTTVEFRGDYQVRDSYAPGKDNGTPQNPVLGVPADSPSIQGWATGYTDYVPGPNVAASWQTPENALGPLGNWADLVVLGDHGTITLTFDEPIGDGPGADLAVYENGFRSGSLDALELGRVAVSSNGTDFAVFDSASRRTTPVGAFEAQDASLVGGLAGKDLAGLGTPFDLALLRNDPLVRTGSVDLNSVTAVKIIDVVGDGNDLDSFGRPLYDPHPTSGSGGYDLTGVAVLNEKAVTPDAPQQPRVAVAGQDVAVTWDAVLGSGWAPVTGYVVRLSDGETVLESQVSGTSHTFTGVPAGEWTATVAAVNAAGTSSFSVPADKVIVHVGVATPDPTTTPQPTPTHTAPVPTVAPAVSSTVHVKVAKSVRRGKKARFRIRVSAPGIASPDGRVTVRFAGRARSVTLVGGRGIVKVPVKKGFKVGPKGRQVRARIVYAGSETAQASSTVVKVRVRR